jgi:hypothetical protein
MLVGERDAGLGFIDRLPDKIHRSGQWPPRSHGA